MLANTQILPLHNEVAAENQVIQTPTIDGLVDIGEPTTSLVVWDRRIPPALYNWLLYLDPDQLPRGRILAKRADVGSAVKSFFDMSEATADDAAQMLANDIVKLANLYAEIANRDKIDIRLEAIQNDACWKFHLDRVALRLVTTYVGEGTQYVEPEFSEQALREQKAYVGPIKRIPKQSVAVFKGANSAPGTGIVHRSPPVSSVRETRLLLCINAPSDASPDVWKPRQ